MRAFLLLAISALLAGAHRDKDDDEDDDDTQEFCIPIPSLKPCYLPGGPQSRIGTFSQTQTNFNTTGLYYAVLAAEMKVQVNVTQLLSGGNLVTAITDLTYSCGSEDSKTFTAATLKGQQELTCNTSSGKSIGKIVLDRGQGSIPQISVSHLEYTGVKARGGLCFDWKSKCPSPPECPKRSTSTSSKATTTSTVAPA
ncbi:hypothetical protein HDU98_011203, partial [Podochytrium sp. JEL0797]